MWCKHDWAVIDKTVLPSPMEQLKAAGLASAQNVNIRTLCAKTLSVLVSCRKCGKLRHFVTVNPDS